MDCKLDTREKLAPVVIKAIKDETGVGVVKESTKLGHGGLGLDGDGKADLFIPVNDAIGDHGCEMDSATPDDFSGASKVGELVDIVWDDVKEDEG